MKLKTKIFIAFFLIILVPFLLSAAILFGVGAFQAQSIAQRYGVQVETLAPQLRLLIMDVLVTMIFILGIILLVSAGSAIYLSHIHLFYIQWWIPVLILGVIYGGLKALYIQYENQLAKDA